MKLLQTSPRYRQIKKVDVDLVQLEESEAVPPSPGKLLVSFVLRRFIIFKVMVHTHLQGRKVRLLRLRVWKNWVQQFCPLRAIVKEKYTFGANLNAPPLWHWYLFILPAELFLEHKFISKRPIHIGQKRTWKRYLQNILFLSIFALCEWNPNTSSTLAKCFDSVAIYFPPPVTCAKYAFFFGFNWRSNCVYTAFFLLFALSVSVADDFHTAFNFVGTQIMSGEFHARLPKPEKSSFFFSFECIWFLCYILYF